MGIEGGAGERKLFDLAHLANLQRLFPSSLDSFSITSSKHCFFALLIAAPLALLASRYSCHASSWGFLLCLLCALLASSTSSLTSSDYQGTQNGAGLDRGTCWAITSFIHKGKRLIEELMSDVEEKIVWKGAYFFGFFSDCFFVCILPQWAGLKWV